MINLTIPFLLVTLSLNLAIEISHGPFLRTPSDSTMRIVWFTDVPAVSHIEWGTTASLGNRAISTHHGLIDANITNHSVNIKGLTPGTTYYYRVVSQEITDLRGYSASFGGSIQSSTYSFETLNPQKTSFSFIAMSDIHENTTRLNTMLGQVNWPEIDMVFYTGDMINTFDNLSQVWGFLDVSVSQFAREKLMVYIMGNHETRGHYTRDLEDYFPLDDTRGEYYYAFTHGNVRFIIMDSGEDKVDTHNEYSGLVAFDPYRVEQANWLTQETQSSAFKNACAKILLAHFPTRGTSTGHGETHLRSLWTPILRNAGIDLALVGHKHSYVRRDPSGSDTWTEIQNSTTSTARVDASCSELRVTVTDPNGGPVDQVNIIPATQLPIANSKSEGRNILLKTQFTMGQTQVQVPYSGKYIIKIYNTEGKLIHSHSGKGPESFSSKSLKSQQIYRVHFLSEDKNEYLEIITVK